MTFCLKWAGSGILLNDSFTWAEALSSLVDRFKDFVSHIDRLESWYVKMSSSERSLYDSVALFHLSELMGMKGQLSNASIEDVLTCPKQILSDELNSYLADLGVSLSLVDELDLSSVTESLSYYTAFSEFHLPVDSLLYFNPDSATFTRAFSLISRLYSISDVKPPVVPVRDNSMLGYLSDRLIDMQSTTKKILSLLLIKSFNCNFDTFNYHLHPEGLEVLKETPLFYI